MVNKDHLGRHRDAMVGEREIPPQALNDSQGMHLYGGYMVGDLRIRTWVPTSIYDPQAARVIAYYARGQGSDIPSVPELVLDQQWVRLKSLPRWDAEQRTLILGREDEGKVKKACERLERKLLDADYYLRAKYREMFSIEPPEL